MTLRASTGSRRLVRSTSAAVLIAAAITVLARLPFVNSPLSPDEAGFLVVARQWHAGGTSLYGNYWVDRPPLLVAIFGLAARLGGAVPLRLMGMVAAVVTVVLAACLARLIGGARAGAPAAVIAAAFLANPGLGAIAVNGELLAAPVVLGGLFAVVAALRADSVQSVTKWAALAGGLTVAALMIKQNMADVVVFTAVAVILSWWQGSVRGRHLGLVVAAGAAGMVATLSIVAAWTWAHGTSLSGVYDAMYPFRFRASEVMSKYGSAGGAAERSHQLLVTSLGSGLLIVVVTCCAAVVAGRMRGPIFTAMLAVLVFDAVSIVLGGNFWSHYLVQPIGVAATLAGVLLSRWRMGTSAVVGVVAAVAVTAWVPAVASPPAGTEAAIGSAIDSVSQPNDTIVTMWGNAQSVEASGLSSPYPYLWSLPVKTLDPELEVLNQTLAGPSAPTWIVTWHQVRSWGLDTKRTSKLLASRYHQVAAPCGHTIYALDGADRAAPVVSACATGR